ncbi:carbonic anhydrase family protein [Helicobacter apodemus]|nr:carbonic anhydrase family protein [Helicobacter apodemus]
MPLEKLNAKMLLPTKYRFYSLKGNLTTPPCTENVQWIILDNPATASAEQIKKLRELFHNNNARTLQDSNNREITFTK